MFLDWWTDKWVSPAFSSWSASPVSPTVSNTTITTWSRRRNHGNCANITRTSTGGYLSSTGLTSLSWNFCPLPPVQLLYTTCTHLLCTLLMFASHVAAWTEGNFQPFYLLCIVSWLSWGLNMCKNYELSSGREKFIFFRMWAFSSMYATDPTYSTKLLHQVKCIYLRCLVF